MRYRRARVPGGCYFFTVVTWKRRRFLANDRVRAALGAAIRETRARRPFRVDAIVLMPDHLHCVWSLPPDDGDFATRWSVIKRSVTVRADVGKVWQPRFWEHLIRDERDYRQHVDYIHYNPVKHGLVSTAREWPWSSFHRYMRAGMYPEDWGRVEPTIPQWVGRE